MSYLLQQGDHMRLQHACARPLLKREYECRPEVRKCSKSPLLLRLVYDRCVNVTGCNWTPCYGRGSNVTGRATGDPSSQCYLVFFFHFYANVQPNVTYDITTEFDYAKRDCGLATYVGVVLQRFEFIQVGMRMQQLCLKSESFLYFVNKIYLPCHCVVFFVVCQLLRPI